MTRGMIPGWVGPPCIVWVFPEEVTPYAKIVTVLSRNTEVNVLPTQRALNKHSRLRDITRPTEASHRCHKCLLGSRLGHNKRRTCRRIHKSLSLLVVELTFVHPLLPLDLREGEDLVPLVGDGNRRGFRIVVSCDPDTIVFQFIVDPRTESSGDSNLVSSGSGDHVGMVQVGRVSRGVTGRRNETTRWVGL